jgi:hypothetical protein
MLHDHHLPKKMFGQIAMKLGMVGMKGIFAVPVFTISL